MFASPKKPPWQLVLRGSLLRSCDRESRQQLNAPRAIEIFTLLDTTFPAEARCARLHARSEPAHIGISSPVQPRLGASKLSVKSCLKLGRAKEVVQRRVRRTLGAGFTIDKICYQ